MSYTDDKTLRTRKPGAVAARDLGRIDERNPRQGGSGRGRAPAPPLHRASINTPFGPVVVGARSSTPPRKSKPLIVQPAQRLRGTGTAVQYGPLVPRPREIIQPGKRAPLDKRTPGILTEDYPPPPTAATPPTTSQIPAPTKPKVSPFVNGGGGGGGGFAKGSDNKSLEEAEGSLLSPLQPIEPIPDEMEKTQATKPGMSSGMKWLLLLGGGAILVSVLRKKKTK